MKYEILNNMKICFKRKLQQSIMTEQNLTKKNFIFQTTSLLHPVPVAVRVIANSAPTSY